MKVLVTGGAGYIGSVLVRRLLKEGHQVRVFDKLFFGKESLSEIEKRIKIIQGDIREFDPSILNGMDGVIHLAALSNDPTAEYNPKANMEINAGGTEKLALACKQKGIKRFIQASSCSIYHTSTPNDEMKYEHTKVNPTVPYSVSKYIAEQKLLQLADKNFCPVILRKGTVFGFSPRMRYDLVVNTFMKSAYLHKRLTVFGGGEMWRPLVDIKDVADAYLCCLTAPEEKVKGQIFNLVHKNYRILELAHWIKQVLQPKINIEVDVQYVEQEKLRSYRVSGKKIKEILGFEPRLGIAQAVNEIWNIMMQGQYIDFDNSRYYNIKWLETLAEMEIRLRQIGRVFY